MHNMQMMWRSCRSINRMNYSWKGALLAQLQFAHLNVICELSGAAFRLSVFKKKLFVWANVLCDGDQQSIPQVLPEKTNTFPPCWKKNKTEMVPCSWWKQIGRRASRWAPYGHQRAISRLYTKVHDGKTLVIRSDQPGEEVPALPLSSWPDSLPLQG